ncbi:hypothetical protein ACPCVL_28470 [Streptomyces koyangensis]
MTTTKARRWAWRRTWTPMCHQFAVFGRTARDVVTEAVNQIEAD